MVLCQRYGAVGVPKFKLSSLKEDSVHIFTLGTRTRARAALVMRHMIQDEKAGILRVSCHNLHVKGRSWGVHGVEVRFWWACQCLKSHGSFLRTSSVVCSEKDLSCGKADNGCPSLALVLQWELFLSAGAAFFVDYCVVHRIPERLAKWFL